MFIRISLAFLVFSGVIAAADESDPAVTLARILAQRGTISAAELSTIQSTEADKRVGELTAVLRRKGVLTDADLPQLAAAQPVAFPAVAQAPASAAPQAPAATPPRTLEIPLTSQTNIPITIYGTLLLNSFYNTASTNIQDTPLFLLKQGTDATGGDKNFGMTARQSRFGLRFSQPDFLGAKLGGNFEFDLFGGKTPLGNGMDMDMFRLRLAYGRLDWKKFSFEAGQDWAVFAPLNPTSLAAYAIPEFSASGNPWIRLPQIRGEFHSDMGNNNQFLFQLAALDPNVGDYPVTTFSTQRQPAIGERGRMPAIESRIAWTRRVDDRDFTLAFSGHYGRGKNVGTVNGVSVHDPVDSWGVALDFSLPFSRLFNLTGEAFEGRSLGIFSVASGEAVGGVDTTGGHGVESRGGWVQAQFNLNRLWQVNLGYGLEVPNAGQLPLGNRWRNQSYMGNLTYKPGNHLTFAWEYRRMLTDYVDQSFGNERGDHVDMAVAYVF